MDLLLQGTVKRIASDSTEVANPSLQVWGLTAVKNRHTCTASDGVDEMKCMLSQDVSAQVTSGEIKEFSILKMKSFTTNTLGERTVIVVTEAEVVATLTSKVGEAASPAPAAAAKAEPKESKSPVSPPYAAQSLKIQSGGSKKVQPIVSLNPYNSSWTIKAKLVNKGPLRTFKTARGEGSVFTAEVIDDQGTAIEVTMFRDEATLYHGALEVGKVYYISKGTLKPANRQYSSVNNNYQMVLNKGSVVEECPPEEVDESRFVSPYEFVAIPDLAPRAGSRTTVDVVGVVTQVSPLGTIHRKSDNAPLERREVTLVDASLRTVSLTLWNTLATGDGATLEGLDAPVLAVKAVRVTDFNGVSLSTVGRSAVAINPTGVPEADELRAWYDASGRGAATTHAGEGLASAGRGGASGGSSRDARGCLADVKALEDVLPAPGAKPEYHNIRGSLAYIKPDQTMWYMAAPDGSNRKVIEDNGAYWCEATQTRHSSFVRRYVASAKATDRTGECWVNLFNDQAEALFGLPADELSEMRDRNDGSYERTLKRACWKPLLFTVQTKTQEYNGERRLRASVQRAGALDFVSEGALLLKQIAAMSMNTARA